jgi:hypothetical protein
MGHVEVPPREESIVFLAEASPYFCAFGATIWKIKSHETVQRQFMLIRNASGTRKQKARDFRPGLLSQKFCVDHQWPPNQLKRHTSSVDTIWVNLVVLSEKPVGAPAKKKLGVAVLYCA